MNRSSFFNRQKVAVTALLSEQSVSDFIVQIRASEFDGADAFAAELKHLPLEERTEEHFKAMINATQLPAMFLSYRNDKFLGADDEARQKYLLLAAQCGAEVIDVMGDLYDPSEFELTRDAVAIKKQMKLIDEIHSIGSKVIMSSHMPVFRTKDEVLEHMLRQSERGADICKLVQGVNTPQELALAVETTMYLNEKLDKPFVHLCGGKYARPHRFMSAALGNSIVFAIHEYRAHQILGGQPPIRNYRAVIDNFGWSINNVK
ncbi:MAG: type I 3-dehydroquinate dehydratase [Lentisphaeria bacterium]|nr:type I 3-dehydroquinate dehydratase [Lentisphaeria bacterium]MBQ7395874.1 type I 3-dehydroquinate dehydratase [Lentisphaeria bacterium]MBR7118749.1 type I 3-dehydroquinate dehydratase [Lentisphaeria bacterium]